VSVLAVDLAAKYSAACLMDEAGAVLDQFDSWGRTETQFIEMCATPWFLTHDEPPTVMVVEDLPHRLPFAALVKQVCRIQGRLIEHMDSLGAGDKVLFVPPAQWRKTYPGLERGTGPDAVVPVAEKLGYTPPDLSARTGKGAKATARKVTTDYCAAFLIARWAINQHQQHGTFDAAGTSRYINV
jgi:hypothetical protein